MPFHFQSEKVHLTYKTWLDMEALKTFMARIGTIRMISIVHEEGDVEEEGATPYEHTHAFVWWTTRPRFKEATCFDIAGIHPNIATRRGMDWAKHIVLKYHLGHKVKRDGKKYFIEPIELMQEGVESWKWDEEQWIRIRDAPTLMDACMDAGITAKGISDVKAIRQQGVKRGFAEIESDCVKEWIETPADLEWNREKQSLVVCAIPFSGKTNWAKAQFEKPFVIEDIDDLKCIPEGCDGLVFDDCEFSKLKLQAQKALADVRVSKTIRARHVNAYKPKLPAIFTTNNLKTLFDFAGDNGAVGVRCNVWEVGSDKMFIE